MGNFLTPVLLKLDPEPSIPVVVLTGILLVFLILILLTVIITIQGTIFDGLAAKQSAATRWSLPCWRPSRAPWRPLSPGRMFRRAFPPRWWRPLQAPLPAWAPPRA